MISALHSFWQHRHLLMTLTRRQLAGRFAGSFLGRLWLLLSPLLLLTIYALFFGEILQAKWQVGEQGETLAGFALLLFSGLLVHQFFTECMSRAPELVLGSPNYVKKIIFPLQILACVNVMMAGVQALFSLFILLVAARLAGGELYWQWLLLPMVYAPLVVVALGISWLLSALGVFLRDMQQVVGFLGTALLFLSPVFYPLEMLPEAWHVLRYVNPLVIIIEQSRLVIFAGQMPDWQQLLGYTSLAVVFAGLSLAFFQRSRRAFADVM